MRNEYIQVKCVKKSEENKLKHCMTIARKEICFLLLTLCHSLAVTARVSLRVALQNMQKKQNKDIPLLVSYYPIYIYAHPMISAYSLYRHKNM